MLQTLPQKISNFPKSKQYRQKIPRRDKKFSQKTNMWPKKTPRKKKQRLKIINVVKHRKLQLSSIDWAPPPSNTKDMNSDVP